MRAWLRERRARYHRLRRLAGSARSEQEMRDLLHAARHFRAVELNVKAFGYELARRMAESLPAPRDTAACHVGLRSKCATQADIESDWAAHWARLLGTPVVYHRKLWELAYVLQAIHEAGHLVPGTRGLGFGCGREPIASLLAAHGVATTVSDLPAGDRRIGAWAPSGQHAPSLEAAFHPHLVDRASFDRLVRYTPADMTALPATLAGYDFCWSTCAFEHLGSIDHGLDFVANAMATLRPGGVAVHTTEYNVDPDAPTIEAGDTVLFQQRHIEALAARLTAAGHVVAPLDFDPGGGPMDHFIDLPPWWHDSDALASRLVHPRHLKLAIGGHVATCFGLVVTKAPAAEPAPPDQR